MLENKVRRTVQNRTQPNDLRAITSLSWRNMVNEVPPEIFKTREGILRPLGWLLLLVIIAVFLALYFFGVMPGGRAAHPPI